MRRQPDIVNSICDLKRLEELVIDRTPDRPTRSLVATTPAENMAGLVTRYFVFGHGERVMRHREAWIDALNATQQADGCWPASPRSCPHCRLMRATGRVTAALWHMGGRPRRPLVAVERLAKDRALAAWLGALNWGHPWGGAGHECIGLAQAMANTGTCTRGVVQTMLDFVNERMRDPRTGLIARECFDKPTDQQFGSTFAFGIIFEFFKVDFPWADRLVRFILTRQHAGGSWSAEFPGGSYNMDATWILSRWTRYGSPLREAARAALRRLAGWLGRQVRQLHAPDKERGLLKIATTLLLLQEVFPSRMHRNRIWRFSSDMTIHP